jgi:hypothetical protein
LGVVAPRVLDAATFAGAEEPIVVTCCLVADLAVPALDGFALVLDALVLDALVLDAFALADLAFETLRFVAFARLALTLRDLTLRDLALRDLAAFPPAGLADRNLADAPRAVRDFVDALLRALFFFAAAVLAAAFIFDLRPNTVVLVLILDFFFFAIADRSIWDFGEDANSRMIRPRATNS